jgi:hypothetical protein
MLQNESLTYIRNNLSEGHFMSFEEKLDSVSELPASQQESLIDIVRKRLIEQRRTEIANDAANAIEDFRNGKLKPETAEELIERLHN